MDRLQLLALASKLRAETLDETPGSGGVTMADVAQERGYRGGWNDRTRSIAAEIEEYAKHAPGMTLKEQTDKVLSSLTERERRVLAERFPPFTVAERKALAPTRRDLLTPATFAVDGDADVKAPPSVIRAGLEADTIGEMLVRAKHARYPRYFDAVDVHVDSARRGRHTSGEVEVRFTRNGHSYVMSIVEVGK